MPFDTNSTLTINSMYPFMSKSRFNMMNGKDFMVGVPHFPPKMRSMPLYSNMLSEKRWKICQRHILDETWCMYILILQKRSSEAWHQNLGQAVRYDSHMSCTQISYGFGTSDIILWFSSFSPTWTSPKNSFPPKDILWYWYPRISSSMISLH